ncbi:putative transcriptional regulatory protein [Escovopsis weberi]|uniref:Putative transcriptional regulatory protein n=1 Tax=Escovopsis weberi TaxID=150374 RepID=A0A0M9VU54_ESCWE|nr:putative transcriptional regulatory protein [Escovopsis weberi]
MRPLQRQGFRDLTSTNNSQPSPSPFQLHNPPTVSSVATHPESAATALSGTTVASLWNAVDEAVERVKINLWETDPFNYITDEVKTCYMRCAYKWSFFHLPTLFSQIRSKTLDQTVAWAMLALIIRFVQKPPDGFGSPIEASNAFAGHTKRLLLPCIDEPNIQQIQVLLMLTGHSWGAGEGKRAWVFLGMAMRMCQIMGLLEESPTVNPTPTREEFIEREERRRTAWTCFLMDSLLSGGRGRERSLSAENMHIQLPCDSSCFVYGEPIICPRIDGSLHPMGTAQEGPMGMVGYSMVVADIWGNIAKWACLSHSNDAPPWSPDSDFHTLLTRLDNWQASLPPRFKYSLPLLHAHAAANEGQAYCYMHCIYYMSIIFLFRSYSPELEMQEEKQDKGPQWAEWTHRACEELAKVADGLCEMLHEMRDFGPFFLSGLVPLVGFTGYTAVGTLLYIYHFPHVPETDPRIARWQQRIIDGCVFLKDMRQSWPMADTWRETIQAMHLFYSNIKTKGKASVSYKERKEMRNAIVDYGALQPSPVQAHDSSTEEEDNLVSEAEEGNLADADEAEADFGAVPMPPADVDLFDTHFDIDAAMRASLADATHGFWEGYPGRVEFTYW